MGTPPGPNFIYMDFSRVIKKYRLDMIYVSGPDKENARLIISQASLDTIDASKMRYPKSDKSRRKELEAIPEILAK